MLRTRSTGAAATAVTSAPVAAASTALRLFASAAPVMAFDPGADPVLIFRPMAMTRATPGSGRLFGGWRQLWRWRLESRSPKLLLYSFLKRFPTLDLLCEYIDDISFQHIKLRMQNIHDGGQTRDDDQMIKKI